MLTLKIDIVILKRIKHIKLTVTNTFIFIRMLL